MPESQVANALAKLLKRLLELAAKKAKGVWPTGFLTVFPRVFAEGTAAKSHETFSADVGDYTPSLEPVSSVAIDAHDLKRTPKNAPWKYLLERQRQPGPIHVEARGKCLVIIAGHHALVCHFSLEGNIRGMARSDYEEMVAVSVPGNNPNKAKAQRLRSFVMPDRFVEAGARKKNKLYKVNILAAIVMEKHAFIVTDFSRMTQLHVVSSAVLLQWNDLRRGTGLGDRLWRRFRGGPDWVIELDEALRVLDNWRASVLEEEDDTAILDALLDVEGPGGGLGQHLANDLLYGLAMHPDTPSFEVCASHEAFHELRDYLPKFMATWRSEEYYTRCAGLPNSNNPFVFHEVSNQNFLKSYVQVYRRTKVCIPAALYDRYQSRGLFDPTHVIGTPYYGTWTPTSNQFKRVEVRLFEHPQNNRYHVIRAIPPPSWNAKTDPSPFKDVSNAGFATTLGPASFYESMQNKLDIKQVQATCAGRPGRPPKISTGRPGRRPNPLTSRSVNRIQKSSYVRQKAVKTIEKENFPEDLVTVRYSTRSQGKGVV
ncbi:hypothetical protein R3P38DRAFT_2854659 [Favolaschia claudopus]|uniref:Uncharacterized protein n=1 Tax=Favolaschia claudopus TaxID=2862362 RepID=A0AAW0DQK2_9AGAR